MSGGPGCRIIAVSNRKEAHMDRAHRAERTYTRRQFLRRAPLGLAGALVVGAITIKALVSPVRRWMGPPDVPGDSIFAPARHPRRRL